MFCAGASRVAVPGLVDWEYEVEPRRHFRFLTCDRCGSQWLDPRPTSAELLRFYPPHYHAYNGNHGVLTRLLVWIRARTIRARHYAKILPAKGGRLFDVGAGDCRHFKEISRGKDYTFAGVEINPKMAALAREDGYDVEDGMLEEMDLTRHLGRYDAVSMNHILEHVLDPKDVLERAYRLLKPGGRLVGQLPTVSSWECSMFRTVWAGYHFPRHLQLFSRQHLARLLESCGFVDVSIRSAPHLQTALSMQNLFVSKIPRSRLKFGRTWYFGLLLFLSLPYELVALVFDRSGVVDFDARRPNAG